MTRIIGKGQERDPERNKRMPDRKASRVLNAGKNGKAVDPKDQATAKKAARDHYAHEADKANKRSGGFKRS